MLPCRDSMSCPLFFLFVSPSPISLINFKKWSCRHAEEYVGDHNVDDRTNWERLVEVYLYNLQTVSD